MKKVAVLCILAIAVILSPGGVYARGGPKIGFVALAPGPDGSLETGARSLILASPDGGIETVFEDWKLGAEAAWSPDGDILAYVTLQSPYAGGYSPDFDLFSAPPEPLPEARLYLMENGQHSPPLTETGFAANLKWSPRGDAILLTLREDTDGNGQLTYDDHPLPYLLDVSSRALIPIQMPSGATGGFYMGWAPDGSAFHIAAELGTGEWWLGLFSPDGGLADVITEHDALDATAITWAPDGSALAYVRITGADGYTGPRQVMIYDLETNESRPISEPMAGVQYISWSPAGGLLAFVAIPEGGPVTLFIFNPGADSMITFAGPDMLYYSRLAFSPDGRWIAFLSDPGEGMEQIFLLEIGAEGFVRLTQGGNAELSGLDWSPDGRYLAFTYATDDTDGDGQITGFDFRSLMIASAPDWSVVPVSRPDSEAVRAESFAWSPGGRWLAYVARTDTDGDGAITSDDWDQLFVIGTGGDFPSRDSGVLLTRGMSVVSHSIRWVP